jgi:amidase
MKYPDVADVAATAERLGLKLSADELEAMYPRVLGELHDREMFVSERLTLETPPMPFPERAPGGKPAAGEDHLNAWLWKCRIGGGAGPLSGRTVGLKDHIALAGVPTSFGSYLTEGYIADIDATVVARLLDAGAEIVGKLNMDNFSSAASGLGGYGDYGRVGNPFAYDHLAGGSSSGAGAAVAAGECDIAVGGDQAGSVRVPAAWCGVLGLKPTFGVVPHTGVVSGSEPSIDHVGPLTRTSADLAAAMDAMSGADGYDHRQSGLPAIEGRFVDRLGKGVEGLRIGVLDEGFAAPTEHEVDELVRACVATLEHLGATARTVSIPVHPALPAAYTALTIEGARMLLETFYTGAFTGHYIPEGITARMAALLSERRGELPVNMKFNFLVGEYTRSLFSGRVYPRAVNARPAYRKAYDDALTEFDVLVMPTAPMRAPKYIEPTSAKEAIEMTLFGGETGAQLVGIGRNTMPFNYTGHPAISIPCGVADGLPVGAQFVTRHFNDTLLVQLASALEAAAPWPGPPVPVAP